MHTAPAARFPKVMWTSSGSQMRRFFTVSSPSNKQNDRIYVPRAMRKKNVSATRLLHTRATFSQSLMVSVGISKLGCTELIFVDPGVKINGQYYRDVLLAKLLSSIRRVSGNMFGFQQDSAPCTGHDYYYYYHYLLLVLLF